MVFLIIEFNNTIGDACQFIIVDEMFLVSSITVIGRESETVFTSVNIDICTAYFAFISQTVVHHRPIVFKSRRYFKVF